MRLTVAFGSMCLPTLDSRALARGMRALHGPKFLDPALLRVGPARLKLVFFGPACFSNVSCERAEFECLIVMVDVKLQVIGLIDEFNLIPEI